MPARPRPHPAREVLRVLLLNCVLTLVWPLLAYGIPGQGRLEDFASSLLSGMLYSSAIAIPATLLMPRLWPLLRHRSTGMTLVFGAALLFGFAVTGCFIAGLLLWAGGVLPGSSFWPHYARALRISTLITLLLGGGATIIETLRSRLHATTLDLRTKELERERALKLATEARLSSLESRLHPHFLFNALNSISSLIPEDPLRAEQLVGRLAALLRFSLDAAQCRQVPLEQELKIVEDYLEIERARFGARLRYRLNAPAAFRQCQLPPLSVQTLVENSVKFAVSPRREGGTITVDACAQGGQLLIRVQDDGPGFGGDALPPGHGLDSLRERLTALYGSAGSLSLEPQGDGMVVQVSLPSVSAWEPIRA